MATILKKESTKLNKNVNDRHATLAKMQIALIYDIVYH